MPCIMARQGDYKYNYIHGHAPQLFDLAADPGEWHNLATDPKYQQPRRRCDLPFSRTLIRRRWLLKIWLAYTAVR
ncbi:MAG: hypothetical protein R2932_16795 [Caldilineaceae bacterium]